MTKRTATRRPALRRIVATIGAGAIVLSGLAFTEVSATAATPTVALVGSLQSELGCAEDWQPACASTELAPTGVDGVWSAEFTVPAGSYDYKVALNDSWDETYG
ncbi:MAG TPA: hypothetical protein VLO00_08195, partial [Cryobacterium sp.]|nr:hypothetical protein [Cryobacterium sp.]